MGAKEFFEKFVGTALEGSGDPSLPTSVQTNPVFWITGTVVCTAGVVGIVTCVAIGCGLWGTKRLRDYFHNRNQRGYVEIPDPEIGSKVILHEGNQQQSPYPNYGTP